LQGLENYCLLAKSNNNYKMKKALSYTLLALGLGLVSYSTFLIIKKLSDARIDSRTVTVEEAMEELKKSR
jgi:hypothetical protein